MGGEGEGKEGFENPYSFPFGTNESRVEYSRGGVAAFYPQHVAHPTDGFIVTWDLATGPNLRRGGSFIPCQGPA